MEKAQQKKQILEIDLKDDESSIVIKKGVKSKPTGLLVKAKQRKQQLKTKKELPEKKTKKLEVKEVSPAVEVEKKRKLDIIEEQADFGWKGLGSRRIVFDHISNEHQYEVSEPELNKQEVEIKNELVHLFKMLADVNVYGMEEEEKKKYLEETLEQIIIDNDIKFSMKEEDEKPRQNMKIFSHQSLW